MRDHVRLLVWLAALTMALTGCGVMDAERGKTAPEATVLSSGSAPEIPEKLSRNEAGVPLLRVYDTAAKTVREMDAETYLEGVLAGEMRNDWPLEALKAQAILARTFVMQFVEEKESKYAGADISTDVSEAQAYSAGSVNETVKRAVRETRGMVATADGKLIHAWFHAHAGGRTELPSAGLDYREGDPDYIVSVDSPDSEDAPEEVKRWTVRFSAEAVGRACADAGVATGDVTSIGIERRSDSGRARTFVVNGKAVSAPALRINLDASRLKSTMIDSVRLEDGQVIFEGRGFGHGVGMSQWGAYGMARDGADAEEIISYYFRGVRVVRMWD